jgi:hypothetical protein
MGFRFFIVMGAPLPLQKFSVPVLEVIVAGWLSCKKQFIVPEIR